MVAPGNSAVSKGPSMNTITPLAPPAPEPEHTGSRHTIRTKVLVAAGAVVALGGAFLAVDLLTNASRHTTHRFTDAVTELDLDVSAGTVRLVDGDDPVVTVDVTTHGGVHRPSHSEMLVGGHLRLHSGCGFDIVSPTCGVDFVVHVPTATTVVARADGATIDLVGTDPSADRAIDVHANGGDVAVRYVTVAPLGG